MRRSSAFTFSTLQRGYFCYPRKVIFVTLCTTSKDLKFIGAFVMKTSAKQALGAFAEVSWSCLLSEQPQKKFAFYTGHRQCSG